MKIGFDVISDLYLEPNDSFNWDNKATSLYCILAGNISSDLRTIRQTLLHLAGHYQGIFYIPSFLEYKDCVSINQRTDQIKKIVETVRNVAILHNHVVVVDGIALLGASCWYDATVPEQMITEIDQQIHRNEDHVYLCSTIQKIQLHLDVTKVIVVTGSVPNTTLYFGQAPEGMQELVPPSDILNFDTQHKITHWVYGNFDKNVEVVKDNITYISNPYLHSKNYYAKRIDV